MEKFKRFFISVGRGIKKATFAVGRWFKKIGLSIADFFKTLFTNPKPMFKTLAKSDGFKSFTASALAAALGLIVGLVVMIVSNPAEAFQGFFTVLLGGFSGGAVGIADVLYFATPILMTGLSVGFAFKTGLFNIGASGQYTMGMFCSMYCAMIFNQGWFVCLLAAVIGGALWGFIPGLFKALFNVNEVITSIMTNYIGMYLVDMLISGNSKMYLEIQARTRPMPELSNIPKMGLDLLFPGTKINGGIIIAIAIAIVIYIVLNKTKFGFELKACGLNKNAARYAGVNEKRSIILSMVIAGALAGIGGALQIQAGASNTYEPVNVLAANGFNGISVALLGASNPIGAIAAAIFISHIQQGGYYVQAYAFKPELIDIIIGIIIYFSAFALIVSQAIARWLALSKKKKQLALDTPQGQVSQDEGASGTAVEQSNVDNKEEK